MELVIDHECPNYENDGCSKLKDYQAVTQSASFYPKLHLTLEYIDRLEAEMKKAG